ncbi:SusC/RagA family TonB-linked outer membrane protein [Flavobacterium noncentrifugens]|uniref:TonB-linked outer membrane protein, SusC/RagA family n=1 Tax=Flavobacterium noncentrifugens TaxID=1128970 RepID=A0A1G8YHP6_9FLAO|nr:TonB-dependent receptor [Flavobacterium noncentrifugens]GEP51232.1 SusC/RagA family TonB-linked outer membrane protein [Flavobacterium noncentrifugens]SDK02399.1 TonB-linked outer membrane protein, SusC/RagA family [Flavobacterium noncentrifugens]
MKSNYLLIYFLLLSAFGFAQSYDIGGVVNESTNRSPIPGVNVQVKNSTLGTTTDFDGKFTLKNVPTGSVLEFSYLGFKSTQFKVSGSNPSVAIDLQEDVQSLEQVVVIGYGSQRKKDVTGAIGLVSGTTIEKLKPIKAEQALVGTLAGVNVTSQSGAPGAGLNIRIRGIGSNNDNSPLIIIDGNISDISLINPSDIESITVLKDAQAGIYGVQGANGVVIIKTKSGKKNGATAFSYNTYVGMQQTTKKMKLLNATEYALLLNESYANGGQALPYPNVSGLGKGTDWQDQVFNNSAPIISHDFSVSGGSDKITYSVSGSHLYQEGIIGGDKADFRRNSLTMALTADLSSKLKLQTNASYIFLNRDSFSEGAIGSVLFNAINMPAVLKPRDENNNFSLVPSTPGFGIEVINPLAQIDNTFNDYNLKKIFGSISLDYNVFKDLVFTGRVGFNTSNSESRNFAKMVSYGGKVFDVGRSRVDQNAINDNRYNLDLYLTYKKIFAEKHNFAFTLGTANSKEWGNGLYASGYDVPNNSWEFADLVLATGVSTGGARDVNSYNYDERLNSYFTRLQYDFDGKYLLSAFGRRDSSTKFGPDNTVAYFYGATAGWVATNENFLKDSNVLNFLKFRGSYGILGNDKIEQNKYIGLLNGEATYVFDNVLVNGTAVGGLPNYAVKWEQAKKFDVGIDLKLFNNKVDIVSDYFIETRSNLLITGLQVSGIAGAAAPGSSPPVVNAGGTRNNGFEFSVGYTDKIGKDFNFNVNYNVTTIKNVVTEVRSDAGYLQAGNFGIGQQPIARMQEGQPIGYFYGLQTDGIFQNAAEVSAHPSQAALGAPAAPGDIRYKDINGDGVINFDDRTKVGSPLPDCTMGLNLNLSYKSVDFAVYTYASLGNDMVRNYERSVTDVNKLNYVLDRWTGEGTSNTVPRVTTGATANDLFSDYFVEDASFYRIQNIQLGYTLNPEFTKKAFITKLRLYASVNNVYTFTKYKGFDPAATSGAAIGGGIDYGFYPTPRTYMFGVNLNF